MALPLEQLADLLEQQAVKTYNAAQGFETFTGTPVEPPGGAPMDMSVDVDPNVIEAASLKLVEAGLIATASATLTPEILDALQAIADFTAPGLYDVAHNPDDLVEVIEGVANGTIPASVGGTEVVNPVNPSVGGNPPPGGIPGALGGGSGPSAGLAVGSGPLGPTGGPTG